MSRTTEDALIDAILASPKDDALRLVYADWLLDHGDRRGELIIAQCTQAHCIEQGDRTSDAYRSARVRERELLREFEATWQRELGIPEGTIASFWRGMIGYIKLNARTVTSLAPVFRRFPLESISFARTSAEPLTLLTLKKLAEHPRIETLREIGVGSEGMNAELDATAALEAAAAADLGDHVLIWPAGRPIPRAPFDACVTALSYFFEPPRSIDELRLPPLLRSLTIDCHGLDPAHLARILRQDQASRLTSLSLTTAQDDHAHAVFERWRFDRLTELEVSGFGPLGAGVAVAFAESGARPLLERFDATFPIDDACADVLRAAPLRSFSARGGISASALTTIFEHPLHSLALGFPDDPAALLDVMSAHAPSTLSDLNFWSFPFDDACVDKLIECQRLERLSLVYFDDACDLDERQQAWLRTGVMFHIPAVLFPPPRQNPRRG